MMVDSKPIADLGQFTHLPLNQPLDWLAIDAVIEKFDVENRESFAAKIADWSRIYRINTEHNKERPSATQMRNLYENIGTGLEPAFDAMAALIEHLQSPYLHLGRGDLPEIPVDDFEALLKSGFLSETQNLPGQYAVNLEHLKALNSIVHYRSQTLRDMYADLKAKKQNPPPIKFMHRRVLMDAISEYWSQWKDKTLYPEFDTHVRGYVGYAPMNRDSQFVFEVWKLIDTWITPSNVKRAMNGLY